MPSIVIACQKCEACLRENCGNCTSCQDMQEFGGSGRMGRICVLRACGVVAEEKRARTRERDREKKRRKRAKIDSDRGAILNFQRREIYAALPKDKKQAVLEQRRENYAAVPEGEQNAVLLQRRENYAAVPEGEQNAVLLQRQEKRATLPEDTKQALLLHDQGRKKERYATMPGSEKNTLLLHSQEKYAKMPESEKNTLLLHSREQYANMPESEKATLLLHSREQYANMPESEKATLLLHSREEYAKLTPEQRSIKLKKQRETYAKVKCPIEREAFLARVRTAMRESREAYTTEQMLRETERNAERQRQIRLRVTIHDDSNRQLLPPGRMCNIDCWDLSSIRYFDVGGLSLVCYHCKAEGFVKENKGKDLQPRNINFGKLCCNKGKCVLNLFPPIPGRLKELYTSLSGDAKYFRQNIRLFNSGMSPASVQVKDKTVKKHGPAAFKVMGQMFRRIGPMLATEGSTDPACLQTYFYDPEFQAKHRALRSSTSAIKQRELDRRVDIFSLLRDILVDDCNNTYLQSFFSVNEYIQRNNLSPENLGLELHATDKPPPGHHPGRYHLPTATEVSLLTDINPPPGAHRTVVCSVRRRALNEDDHRDLRFFQDYHRSVTPLTYTLLFPEGTDGWTIGKKTPNGKGPLHHMQHLRYHMMSREGSFNVLHSARKLYQQYVVDEIERHQTMELAWIHNNQKTIRADLYRGLQDAVQKNDVQNSGRVVVLPASHTCSDRWYHNKYKNAMAIVRVKGKPSFFITMTMDANCAEVKILLKPGETPYDRFDIVNRVYEIKRNELLRDITKKHIFGECDGHVAVIEFQKRGAPHCHILIWIKEFEPTAKNIDDMICAEIPPPNDPLHEIVVRTMIHGPCGPQYNNDLSCCKNSSNGTCSKGFPRTFNSSTIVGDGSFPEYRRRSPAEGGHVCKKFVRPLNSKVTVDNRNVVAYSPYLLKKFKCHINVEYCASIVAIKYLFLYHFKGEDLVTQELDFLNEISKFQARKYISSCYAHWRAAEFDMVRCKPAVHQLPVHLFEQQSVTYDANEKSAEAVLKEQKYSMLTEYFAANVIYGEAATSMKYEDFPIKFVWQNKEKMWTQRCRETVNPEAVGRMVSIHPKAGDAFYMRLLLKNRTGALSYEDLRTIGDVVHPDNKSACIDLDLCESDKQWIDCLDEAVFMSCPRSIRQLFANILLHCQPSDPLSIYNQFRDAMSEDFLRNRRTALNLTDVEIQQLAWNDLLLALTRFLEQGGTTNEAFNIPMPDNMLNDTSIIEDEMEYDESAGAFFEENHGSLNEEQKHIFDSICNDIFNGVGGLHRIDAPGGSGKTWLANVILCWVRMSGKIAISTAMSGIAATMLRLGTTLHKRMGVPIPCTRESCSKLKLNSKEAQTIRDATLIMIDEISMMNWKILNMLDRMLRVLMNCDVVMGGKCVILMGDLRQCPPVVKGGKRPDIVSDSIINGESWSFFKVHHLIKNMRVERMISKYPERKKELLDYASWLLKLGNGTLHATYNDLIDIPTQMVCTSTEELEDKVFDDFEKNMYNTEYLSERAIMSSRNDLINEKNFKFMEKLPGEMKVSYSRDTCLDDDDNVMHDPEILNRINGSGVPPHRLPLKIGAMIILIKNLDVRHGHCNGTRYMITNLTNNLIEAQKVSGGEHSKILIPRIPMISESSSFPVPFKRTQFPVLGAYYLTINRAQGQTLLRGGMFLDRSVLSHGHLYVGFGRCGDPRNFFVYANQSEFENLKEYLDGTKVYTKNVIYPELMDL